MAADETTPLIQEHPPQEDVVVDTMEDAEVEPPGCRYLYYTLPLIRYTNLVRTVLFVDAILALVLWVIGPLMGGNNQYFVDNILDFHMVQSVFDLALVSALKLVLLVILYSNLEDTYMFSLRTVHTGGGNWKRCVLHAAVMLISLGVAAYCTTKAALVLRAALSDVDYVRMDLAYDVMMGSTTVFSIIELLLAVGSFTAMRRLKAKRIVHRVNSAGQDIDKKGVPIKRNANLARLATLAKPEVCLITVATLAMLVSSGSTIIAPLFFGRVIDAAKKSMSQLNKTVVLLLLIYLAGSVASSIRSWLFTLAGQRLVARLRRNLFFAIIRQEVAFFDTNRTGELTNRLSSDTQIIQNAITVNVSMLVRYLLQIFGSLTLMFILNPALTGVLIAVVPIISIGAVQYGGFVKKLQKEFQDRLGDASTTAEESISSIRTVRSFVGEDKANHAYGVDIWKSYAVGKKMALIQGFFDGTIGIISQAAITLVLWYGGKLVYEGHVTAGILTSFLLYTLQVAMAFAFLSSLYGDFMKAVGASVRVFELLDRVPKVSIEGGKVASALQPVVDFEDVHFTYPSRPDTEVLKGVTFSVTAGQMVALVGPSGGGKSTIVHLVERFYDIDSGKIKLGGDDICDLDPKWFRTQMALVSQEPTLFAHSIKDNIGYGRDATMSEIMDAAKQANAHDFVMSFEEGYDTMVGERGVRLSGGQKQRIAIARALIMNPTLLLLDEATSALDAESEHLVQEAIDRAMKGRTVIVIAHRLSTVRSANKVIVIDKGMIAEQGSHDELLAADGVYKRLILRQLMESSKQRSVPADDDPLIDLGSDTTDRRHSPVSTSDIVD